MNLLIHALILYFVIEVLQALPWVAKAIDRGGKPWSCHACMLVWVGLLSLPCLYGFRRLGSMPWQLWLATLGVAHLFLRASWALRAVALRDQWVEAQTDHEA